MNFTMDSTTILIIILIVIVLVLIGLVVHLYLKLKKFLIGASSTNLDESITSLDSSLKELQTFKNEVENYLTTVEKRLKKSVQAVETVRFNPFKGSGAGGNQSFATAFLTEDKDGVVVSSLYSRERVSIYAKPVKSGQSEFELSDEEKEALVKAQNSLK